MDELSRTLSIALLVGLVLACGCEAGRHPSHPLAGEEFAIASHQSRPSGKVSFLRGYQPGYEQARDELIEVVRRLEAGGKSLFGLYQYGRLHGCVRLRWGFIDERIPAPWVHRDEVTLYNLKEQAYERGVPLEVVVGSAPGWAAPWSRLQLSHVEKEQDGWRSWLVDDYGYVINEDEIQMARVRSAE